MCLSGPRGAEPDWVQIFAKEILVAEAPQSNAVSGNGAQQQVQVRVDERNMSTSYANAFRTNGTAEEVILDFGMNQVIPAPAPDAPPAVLFQIGQRVILNYYSAKRLAMALSQMIRRHEDQFGQIELDVTKRAKSQAQA